jgi:hypothetical protein
MICIRQKSLSVSGAVRAWFNSLMKLFTGLAMQMMTIPFKVFLQIPAVRLIKPQFNEPALAHEH